MKSFLTVGLALGLISQPAAAAPQDVSSDVIRIVAEGCRPGRMFTLDATQPYDGGRMLQLGPAAAPLRSMEVIATSRSKTLVGVELWAYQPDDAGPLEARRAFADGLMATFDAAIVEAGLFTARDWDEDKEAFVYSGPVSDPDASVTLELAQMGVSVIAGCADEGRRQLAFDEMLGRTRIERPREPRFPAPQRVSLADCDDPARAEEIYDTFELGGGWDVMNIARAYQEYFEHLTQWYGQEMMDKGVWTQAQRDAFLIAFLRDRVILAGLEEQMARLSPLLSLTLGMADAREAGDSVGSCRAMVEMVDLVVQMDRTNRVQWARATSMYRAEAERLGVTLD
ncbi:MAG: hypothetical protein EON90_06570 [Brevundimonas sp.]|nr:MAG: hypothetical protein EON90_06570 [Brevundimonas sp.]